MLKKSLALACLCLAAFTAHAEVINVDNAELSRLMGNGIPLIDIRTEAEWKSIGVIAGSKTITYFDANGNVDTKQWLTKASPLAGAAQPVILICRSGRRSAAAAKFLSEQAGYKTVYNVTKGLNGWAGESRPLTPHAAQ